LLVRAGRSLMHRAVDRKFQRNDPAVPTPKTTALPTIDV
jgi:hypothetical protein